MKPPHLPRRVRILMLVLGVLASVWLFIAIETRVFERGLRVLANSKAQELAQDVSRHTPSGTHADTLSEVTAAKDYLIFGETRGKVHVYVRIQSPQRAPFFSSYDSFYVLRENAWIEEESGACADLEAQTEGHAAFAANVR